MMKIIENVTFGISIYIEDPEQIKLAVMSSTIPKVEGIQPVFSFIFILVIGLVLALFVIENDQLVLPIILLSFFVGLIVAGIELWFIFRKIRKKEKKGTKTNFDENHSKDRLARFVAELFDEDIPFDDDRKQTSNDLE